MSEVEGESGMGARPKIMTEIDDEYWMIKFPAQIDGADAGVMEYDYFLCAKACGIPMSDSRLFPSTLCQGYFGTKRFDRYKDSEGQQQRIHVLTCLFIIGTTILRTFLTFIR